jgi:hypothetical protein
MKRHDYDSPWKEILSDYFQEFLQFFFPVVSQEIEWRRGYELLDKELRKIARDAEVGVRVADQLVKVWQKNGEETWVLIHIEVQAQQQAEFAQRMYVYDYRIYDRYHRPVANFAVLADDNLTWRPSEYLRELWGSSSTFRFPVVKILDYRDQWDRLEASNNPFAIVAQAHLKTIETQQDDRNRSRWKVTLAKELYKRGFSKADIVKLYRFIDWLMILPEELERQCFEELRHVEEEYRMPYITTAERIGREKGLKEGRKEGKLIGEILFAQRVLKLTIYDEDELQRKSLEELARIVEQFEVKLTLMDSQPRS